MLALALGVTAEREPEAAHAAAPSGLEPHAAAELVVVATAHDEDAAARRSEVRLVTLGGGDAPTATPPQRVLGIVSHAPGAVVRGDLAGATPFVVADEEGAPDRDYGAALFRVDGRGARRLVGGIGHARRPLASADGLVYVERGVSGIDAPGGRLDALTLAAVDPASGAIRAIYSYKGFALHLAGELGAELVVYRVSASGADIVLVERATGRSRLVSALVPMARDFSIDRRRGALVYVNRDAQDPHTWRVLRMDLATGLVTQLASAADDAPAPFALPGGDTVWTAPGRRGLASALGEWFAPLGPGFDAVRAVSPDGAWLAIAHVPAVGMDALAVARVSSGPELGGAAHHVTRLGAAERVEPLGFVGGEGGAR